MMLVVLYSSGVTQRYYQYLYMSQNICVQIFIWKVYTCRNCLVWFNFCIKLFFLFQFILIVQTFTRRTFKKKKKEKSIPSQNKTCVMAQGKSTVKLEQEVSRKM